MASVNSAVLSLLAGLLLSLGVVLRVAIDLLIGVVSRLCPAAFTERAVASDWLRLYLSRLRCGSDPLPNASS